MSRALIALLALPLTGCEGVDPVPPDPCAGALALLYDGESLTASRAGCGALDLRARALGEGTFQVDFELSGDLLVPTIQAAHGPATFRGLSLEGDYALHGQAPLRLWRQGYQSWSWSGVVAVEEPTLGPDGLPQASGDRDTMSFLSDDPSTSWWVGLVGRPAGPSLLAGALSSTRTAFYTAASPDRLWLVWGNRGEEILLQEGETLRLDPVMIGFGSEALLLMERWASAAAQVSAPRFRDQAPPVGWGTWYAFWAEVDERDVRENLEILGLLRDRAELRTPGLVQIDDGWERLWGDWTANERFPSGMAALARDIRDAGFEPGIWMAPFYVSRETSTWADHPDWWVLDPSGQELSFNNLGTGDYAILDVTVPEAGEWMAAQVRDRVSEGYTYLKLDFLYAGAQEGTRSEPVTGMEAYHIGMALLREAAGEQTYILACGAPLLPSLGWVEGYRTGTDITSALNPTPELATLRWQARSTAARAWSNGRWWWNDADAVLVGEALDERTLRGALGSWALSGGAWILGDDLRQLPPERLELALHPGLALGHPRPLSPLDAPSGWDLGPLAEALNPDDAVPLSWIADQASALLNLSDQAMTGVVVGGQELFTGASISVGTEQAVPSGEARIWSQ